MELTPQQARHSLDEIHDVTRRLRKSLAADVSGYLMLWGLVWTGAFLVSGYSSDLSGMAWAIGNTIGGVGSALISILTSRQKVEPADRHRQGWRFFALWVSLFAFVGVWLWLLRPTDNAQTAAFVCTAIMFLYVVMGLWLEAWILVWLGLLVTTLTVIGYQTIPQYFHFWMAAAGGGSLFIAGLYIARAWR